MEHHGQTLRAAIADLARNGCDLTDPALKKRDREEDAHFYLGYLEEYCGTPLTLEQVLSGARAMMKDGGSSGPRGLLH